jgi:hypothetical protein
MRMKSAAIGASVFLLATMLCAAQQSKVVVRFVDARNGHPISDSKVNVWLGKDFSLMDPDAKDEIALDAAAAQPRTLRVMPDMRLDCRSKNGHSPPGDQITYSLEEILSKGIVGVNVCGKATATPSPGVLILFVRPLTAYEKSML